MTGPGERGPGGWGVRFRRAFHLPSSAARAAADVDEELRFHIDARTADLLAAGHDAASARAIALREFGDVERVAAECRDLAAGTARARGRGELAASVGQDVRVAFRGLRRTPALAATVVLTTALGVGATTTVFSVVSAVLLRPLPYREGDRIVVIGEAAQGSGARAGTTSYPNFADWQRASRSFEAMALYTGWGPALTGAGAPERLGGALVTAGVFDVLRTTPARGRPMVPADNRPGSAPVVVLSDGFWHRRFGGDPAVVGRALTLNGVPRTIVAVLPPGFRAPGELDADVWGNMTFDSGDTRGARYLRALARLAPGVSPERAAAEMRALSARLARSYPNDNAGLEAVVTPLREELVGDVRTPILLLLGASGLVLLVACANLSNLLTARGLARAGEFAVRSALGAGRGRVARQVLVESVTLAAVGAAAGVALARLSVHGFLRLAPEAVRAQPATLDVRVLAFALGATALTGVLAGLAPALGAAHADPYTALKASGARATAGTGRVARDVLSVAQLALALTLLTGAGLLVKSLARLQAVDPGIRPDGVLAMSMNLPPAKYPGGSEPRFFDALLARVAATPGVGSAAVTSILPFGGGWDRVSLDLYGEPARVGAEKLEADRYIVSAGYFRTMGVPLVAGRLLDDTDRRDTPRVAVVDEVFARRLAPGGSPLGRRVSTGDSVWATVVGVVGHVRHYGLDVPSGGQLYLSHVQVPWRWMNVVVRARDGIAPAALAPAVREAVHDVDADQPVFGVTTMAALMHERTAARRFVLVLLGAFAGVALLLAAVGLYGVMAYTVAQRRREIGVRVALGATPAVIGRMIVRRAVVLAAWGVVLGAAGALAGGRLLTGLLFGVRPADPLVFAGVAAGLAFVALAASYGPARRATRVDPAAVLRAE